MTTQNIRNVLLFAIFPAILLLGPGAIRATATPILDQSFIPPPTAAFTAVVESTFATVIDSAQTFEVGISGTLTNVDVLVGRSAPFTGDLIVDVRPTASGVPIQSDSGTLARQLIPASSVPTFPGFVGVDLSPFQVPVTTGEVLAIVLRAESGGLYSWIGDHGNPYPFGSLYQRTNASPNWIAFSPDVDMGFETLVSPVSEPGSMMLLGSGLLGVMITLALMQAKCRPMRNRMGPRVGPLSPARGQGQRERECGTSINYDPYMLNLRRCRL